MVEYANNLFEQYQLEPNPEHWCEFPELMWDLGFEMDAYSSAPSLEILYRSAYTEKDIQDKILSEMKDWKTQEVGNFIFSRYRELTHWSDYGYPEEQGAYFFERAFSILQSKLSTDWKKRNTIPSLECFSEMVIIKFKRNLDENTAQKAEEFLEDEGAYHIRNKYLECVKLASECASEIPKFYGRYVSEAAFLLGVMF